MSSFGVCLLAILASIFAAGLHTCHWRVHAARGQFACSLLTVLPSYRCKQSREDHGHTIPHHRRATFGTQAQGYISYYCRSVQVFRRPIGSKDGLLHRIIRTLPYHTTEQKGSLTLHCLTSSASSKPPSLKDPPKHPWHRGQNPSMPPTSGASLSHVP
jgi:hypothetical protein